MSVKIAEVVITVNFEDGESTVFTVSPSGQLCPSTADGVAASCQHWLVSSRQLVTVGLKAPHVGHQARNANGSTCWPWIE